MPHHYFMWPQPPLLQLLGNTHCDHTAVPAAAATLLVLVPVALLLGHTYHCCTRHCCSTTPPLLGNTCCLCTAIPAAVALCDGVSSIRLMKDRTIMWQLYWWHLSMHKAEKFRMENGGGKLGDGSDVTSSRQRRTKFEGEKRKCGDGGDIASSRRWTTKFEGSKKVDGQTGGNLGDSGDVTASRRRKMKLGCRKLGN
ncbi:hypothetical protein DFH07DRAFT_766087 [Mycena maculata]|uniref:Uncharacterized protein n=1 Tax=Mycena maculata TaxID=230809 RepID=A0AAD7K3X0_9AGAR|nr:hypothetical protein DFH07DRAFT_766087 [Mycena maculata]